MPADAILVVDAGTSALRAVAVRADGHATVVAREPWQTFVPDDAQPYGREFSPADVVASVERLLSAAADHQPFAGIALTGQREGMAFVDESGGALLLSPNVDARAAAEGIAIDAGDAALVYAVTGHLPSLMQLPAKLAWLRANRPDAAARVRYALPLVDWIGMVLTGQAAASRTLAAENGMLDVASGEIAVELLEQLGVPPTCLPPIVPDGAGFGQVGRGALAGLPVILAGADTQCALVGMRCVEPAAVGLAAGWSAPVQMVTLEPIFDCEHRTWTSVHAPPARWILESNAGEAGRVWDWICTLMGLTPQDAAGLAATAPAGSQDAMAVLGPRVMRASAMNAGVGALTLPLPLVMSAPGRGDMLRSVLESIAYAVRANLEQLEIVSGTSLRSLSLGGGMSRSELFSQIVADVVDRPVEVASSPETSAVGAAVLASVSLGIHPSSEDAVAAMTSNRAVEPEMAASLEYDDCYDRWCALSDSLAAGSTEDR